MLNDKDVPLILKFETEAIREKLRLSFLANSDAYTDLINKTLEESVTPERIKQALNESIPSELKYVIHETVKKYFREGPGKKLAEEYVAKNLNSIIEEAKDLWK